MKVVEDSRLFGYIAWGLIGSFSIFTIVLVIKLHRVANTLAATIGQG